MSIVAASVVKAIAFGCFLGCCAFGLSFFVLPYPVGRPYGATDLLIDLVGYAAIGSIYTVWLLARFERAMRMSSGDVSEDRRCGKMTGSKRS